MANSARKRSNETNPPCVTPNKISRKIARGKNSTNNNNSSNSPSTSSVGFHRINPDTNSNQNYEFKDGFITKIFLQNFMTHAKFELEPNAKVNLITGENGAGKSSILQAIVVGLGGKAADGKRSSNLRSFIRLHQSKAVVRINLYNGGEEAYKPEEWGNEIIFEKTIYEKSGHLLIKGASGKEVRNTQDLKDSILAHFHIELNNPMTVLQQDETKSFFDEYDQKGLYKLFLKGSMMETVNSTNKRTMLEIDQMNKANVIDHKKKIKLQKEMERLAEIHKELKMLDDATRKYKNKKDNPKWAWSKYYYLDRKNFLEKSNEKEKLERTMQELEEKIVELNISIDRFTKTVEKNDLAKAKLANTQQKLITQQKELTKGWKKKEEGLKSLSDRIEAIENEKSAILDTMKLHNDEMKKIQKSGALASGETTAQSKEQQKGALVNEHERLKQKDAENDEKITQEGDKRQQKGDEIRECERVIRETENAIKSKEKAHNEKMKKLDQDLSQPNELGRYTKAIVKLVEDIDKNEKLFKAKPIGPLGRYIRINPDVVKDPSLCSLIEVYLGMPNLKSFIVENKEDRVELEKLMEKHWPGYKEKQPMITTKKRLGKRHNVLTGRIPKSVGIETVLDCLTFYNHEVFNYFVDKKQIERTIVSDDDTIERLFYSVQSVPRNTSSAITTRKIEDDKGIPRDRYFTYNPPTRGNYSSYHLPAPRDFRNLLISEKDLNRQIRDESRSFHDEITLLKNEVESKKKETLQKLFEGKRQHEENGKLLRQEKQNLLRKMTEIRMKEAELNKKSMSIDELKKIIQKNEKKHRDLESEEEDKKQDQKKIKEEIDDLKTKITPIQEEIGAILQEMKNMDEDVEPKRLIKRCEANRTNKEIQLKKWTKEHELLKRECEIHETAMKQSEVVALNTGEVLEESECFTNMKEYEAQKREQEKRKKQLEEENGTQSEVLEEYEKARSDYHRISLEITKNEMEIENLGTSIMRRIKKGRLYEEYAKRMIKRDFKTIMDEEGMIGEVNIKLKNKEMNIFVGPSQSQKDLSSGQVSGGERTKILSLFFHTLWKHLSCPFRALDEWDCNLDHKERRCVEEVLVETSKKMSFQTFFISPQDSVYANSDSPPELLKLIRLVKN